MDVHKSHLVGVLSEAQALIESAGLLSEPPPVTFTSVPPTFSPYPEDEVTVPPAHSAGAAAEPEPQGETTGEHMELGPHAEAEDNGSPTSDWDPRYLEDRGGVPAEARPAPPVRPGANQEALALAGERIGEAKGVVPGETESAPAPESAATIALDERALDSFFSERDLGDDRGPSRFRRRQ